MQNLLGIAVLLCASVISENDLRAGIAQTGNLSVAVLVRIDHSHDFPWFKYSAVKSSDRERLRARRCLGVVREKLYRRARLGRSAFALSGEMTVEEL